MTASNIVTALLVSVTTSLGTIAALRPASPPAPMPVCAEPARTMARLELVFGTSRPNQSAIGEDEWGAFLDAEVTPRFPDGFTVLQGPGQWRGPDGVLVRERSYVLVVWHEPTPETDAAVEAIRASYRQRFEQDSVMRIEGRSCVSF